jgi:hypothetical protein
MLIDSEWCEPVPASSLDAVDRRIAVRRCERWMIESRVKAQERQRGYIGRNLTTHSTRPLDSIIFIVVCSGLLVCCPLAAG